MSKSEAKKEKSRQAVRYYCFPVIVRKTSRDEVTRLRNLFLAEQSFADTSAAIFFRNRFAVPTVPMR